MRKYFEFLQEMLYMPLQTSSKGLQETWGSKTSIWGQLKGFFSVFKKYTVLRKPAHRKGESLGKGSSWFYAPTINNVHALAPLFSETKGEKAYISLGKDLNRNNVAITGLNDSVTLSELLKAAIISLVFVGKNKKARPFLEQSFVALLTFFQCSRIIHRYSPRAVFFANDHSLEPRAMLIAAREANIPTIYLQHACVSDIFPPLGYSIALLDGHDATSKYKMLKGVPCRIYEVGMIKLDEYKTKRNFSPTIRRVSFCVNPLDDEDIVLELIRSINKNFPGLQVTIRFHPRYRTEASKLAGLPGIHYSGNHENAFDFFAAQDLSIAGKSSVHLEAVLMNVISLQYDFDSQYGLGDYYGFVKNNLALPVGSAKEVSDILRNFAECRPSDWYKRGDYYVSNNSPQSDALEKAVAVLREEKIL